MEAERGAERDMPTPRFAAWKMLGELVRTAFGTAFGQHLSNKRDFSCYQSNLGVPKTRTLSGVGITSLCFS